MLLDYKKEAWALQDKTVEFRRDIHAHPEISYQEVRTTAKVMAALREVGLEPKALEPTGCYVDIVGDRTGKTVALRADMDALTIGERTGLDYASCEEGLMHACGHDIHTATLLSAVRIIAGNRDKVHGRVRAIFQPAEEVATGASTIIRQGVLEGVDAIYGIHIFAGEPLGKVFLSSGAIMAGADRFEIRLQGVGGHASAPHKGVDAVVAASALVMNLQTLVSREYDPQQAVVLTIGKMEVGTRFNIIADSGILEGTIRTFDPVIRGDIPQAVRRVAEMTAETFRAKAMVDYQSLCSITINHEAETNMAYRIAEEAGLEVEPMKPVMGSEDFSEYLAVVPGAFLIVGGGEGAYNHHPQFNPNEDAMTTSVALYAALAMEVLNQAD